jgi:hypothetical protein
MEIVNTRHSAILTFRGLPAGTTSTELADWLWKEIGLCLQATDIEAYALENGGLSATVRVPRGALADFLDRAVAQVKFQDRFICVRPKYRSPRPTDGREEER